MKIINKSDGLVSLISTIVLSVLLLTVVVGLAIVMVGVQRQATDSDQANRAYFAAQSGVEDALLTLKSQLAMPGGAANVTSHPCASGPVSSGTSYVCQTVNVQTTNISDVAQEDYTNQYEVDGNSKLSSIRLYWNLDGKDNKTPGAKGDSTTFPPGSAWTYPAVMELTDTAFTSSTGLASTGNVTASSNPVTQIAIPRNAISVHPFGTTTSIDGKCTVGSVDPIHPNYNCVAVFNGFDALLGATANHILRLRPRYATAGFLLEFYPCDYGNGASCAQIPVQDNKATIDVTAKSGDVLRRVQSKVKIRSTATTGLDYVLFADSSICKTFSINVAVSPEASTSPTPCP
jgi:Tfp pilus assembly protein PilX